MTSKEALEILWSIAKLSKKTASPNVIDKSEELLEPIQKDLEVLEVLKRMLNDPQGYIDFECGIIDVSTTGLDKEETKLLTDWLSEEEE